MTLLLLLRNQTPYHQTLLDLAARLLSDNEPTIAIVAAHMACEIYTEQVISAAFQKKGAAYLEDAVTRFYSGSSLANDRVRRLYAALTGDEIQKGAFWSRFTTLSDRRNDAIHDGKQFSAEDAKESCDAARDFTAHLDKVMKSMS